MRAGLLGSLLWAALLAVPVGARAHTELTASRPGDGDTLAVSPSEVWLEFTEPIEAGLSEVRILSLSVDLPLTVRADPSDAKAIRAALPAALAPGSYRIVWRVVSADGHRVQGTFVFTVLPEPEQVVPPPPAPPPAVEQASPMGPTSWPLGLLRGVATCLLLAVAGMLAVAARLAPSPSVPRSARLLALAAPLALLSYVLAWTAYVSPAGLGGAALASAFTTLPGRIEAIRLALTFLTLWALVLARRPGLAAVFATAAVAVSAGLGHAAARLPWLSIPAKAGHLLAIAIWLGGLLHLATGALRGPSALGSARRVSAMALTAVLVVLVTGVLQAFVNLSHPSDLVRSAYGILVLVKAAGLTALVGFGAFHRTRLIPRMTRGESGDRLERSVRREILVMGIVVLVAGLLAYTPMPGE